MKTKAIRHEDLFDGEMPVAKNLKEAREIRKRLFNLGDKVHAVAQPIAKVIDKVAGTNIQSCGGCARRREALNKLTQFNS